MSPPPTAKAPRTSRNTRRLLLAGSSALVLLGTAVVTTNANASAPPPPAGWTSVWTDDFTGSANTLPSSANWIIDTGTSYPGGPANWGTGEIQTYTNQTRNLALDGNGNLRITPLKDGNTWTSARIETQRSNFKAPAGGTLAIEGRIQMPNITGNAALGYWPAFWALGAPYRGNYQNWPGIGEFDIMENVNGINSVWGVLHCGVAPGGPCNEFNGIGASRACPGASCQSAFHTYRFEWDDAADVLRWYVDGQQYHSVSRSQIGDSAWNNMTNHAGYFILLNVAMGGGFPNGVAGFNTPTADTQPGASMFVDYVTVQTRGGGTTNPPSSNPPNPGNRDAYSTIQAESFNAQNGIQTETTGDSGGGQNIGWAGNGDWVRFDGVNFGNGSPARTFSARVASGAAGGVSGLVEVRLGSPTATPIGSFAIANTGGWQTYRTVPGAISPTTGTHTVYLTFRSGQPADFVNTNWFTFSR
jgi:hypothetical protein